MTIAKFKNIGPIKEAELELGDLTIIAGQNNTGKTYLVYTLYSFLDLWNDEGFQVYYSDYPKKSRKRIVEIAQQLQETGAASMEPEEYQEMSNWLIKKISTIFSEAIIYQVFSSPKAKFEDAFFQFEPEENTQKIEHTTYIQPSKDRLLMKSSFKDEKLTFKLDNCESAKLSKIIGGIHSLFEKTTRNNHLDPYLLSAVRLSISLFYKELDFTKNRLVEELQNLSDDKRFDPFRFLEKQSARYAQPIKDNIDFTRDLWYTQKEKSQLTMDKQRSVEAMMDAYYKVTKDEIQFISKKRGKNRFVIPLHLASSSAQGLSDLYFYLKHRAAPGQILIIDEPESHLSPSNQILMARLLVFCVNKGLKVLITTHSDYIVKEINNLIILHTNFEKKEEFLEIHKKDYTENDHLDPHSVRAYICENGGLRQCNIDERGIDGMTVFDKTIENINRVSAELDMYMRLDARQDD